MNNKPSKFVPAREVHDAHIMSHAPAFIRSAPRRGRRWAGIRYERKAHAYFSAQYGDAYISSPWITFRDGSDRRPRYCQPDALIIEPRRGRITVLEIKYQHTELAFWQLFYLYLPVIESLFPRTLWHFAGVEICARFDCAVQCPETPVMRRDILDALPRAFNVHLWRP